MKFYKIVMYCVTVFTLSLPVNAAAAGFTVGKVKCNLLQTPRYQIQNYPPASNQQRWLGVAVDYRTPAIKAGNSGNKYRWLDDVTMEVDVLFPAMIQNKQIMAHAKGSVDFWSIELDGRKHYALMLLQPQILARYGLNRAYKTEDFIAMVALFRGRKMIFKAYTSHRKLSTAQIMRIFARYSGKLKRANYLELGKVILARDKTPWAFVQYNKYDMIKLDQNTGR